MQTFDYIARDLNLAKKSGTIVATDQKAAALSLTRSGLVPIKISACRRGRFRLSPVVASLFFSKLLFLTIFCSSLSRLLRSGLTIPQALNVLRKQFKQEHVRRALQQVSTRLNQGRKLSDALSASGSLFPDYLVALCRAGEATGSLEAVLLKGSEFFERLRKFRNKLLSALVYPTFLGVLAIVAVAILLTFVLPRISHLYQEFQAELPWQTKLLMTGGAVAVDHYMPILAAIVLMFLLVLLGSRGSRSFHEFLGTLKYRLPVLGKIFSLAETADQLSVTGILVSNGVPLSTALRATRSVTSNPKQSREIAAIAVSVDQGKKLAHAVGQTRFIPDFAKEIITLGEEANCMEESLENGSEIIKSEVDKRLTIFMNLFEPLMVLLIALVIGFVVFSILLPLVNLDILAQ